MRPYGLSLLLLSLQTALMAMAAEPLRLESPDGQISLVINIRPDEGLAWNLEDGARTLLADCPMGFSFRDAPEMAGDWQVLEETRTAQDSTWNPLYGERSTIRDHYNQLVLRLEETTAPHRRLTVTFRAYDEGIAFNYTFPEQPGLDEFTITEEKTGFNFLDEDAPAWAVSAAQGEYRKVPVKRIRRDCERPLVVEVAEDCCVAIGEARLVDYARMRLTSDGDEATIQAQLASEVRATAPYTTPWRVVLVGDSPGALVEHNDLFLNLNNPCAIADTSWIKPGKIIREVTLTTAGGKACVDFAVAQGLQYIHYDAGWYGHEYDESQDATTVTPDPKRTGGKADLDLQEVIRYAEEHGIGVWVYVNQRHLTKQLDEILPLYREWGLKGVKYGFVNVGSQEDTIWLHEAVRKAAENHLMVDIHDEYRPTGFSRTYPNLLTQEGIRGNETMPTASHNVITAFTRMICGAGDYTICWYTPRIQTTHAHQLAASITFYSPLLFLYWYDKPEQFEGDTGTEFLKQIPSVWDNTRILGGEIGEYIVLARRSGDDWYLGVLNGGERPPLSIPLDFLDAGQTYEATCYRDGDVSGDEPFAVNIDTQSVTQETVLEASMASNGGFAARIVPAE